MRPIFTSVCLITILCIVSTLSMTLLEKHRTMKLVVCECDDKKHNETNRIDTLEANQFMAMGIGNDFGTVAVYNMFLEPFLSKRYDEKKHHFFVEYIKYKNTVIKPLTLLPPAFIFDASETLDPFEADKTLPLYFAFKRERGFQSYVFDATSLSSSQTGSILKVAAIYSIILEEADRKWESLFPVTAKDGIHEYSLISNSENNPQLESAGKNTPSTQEHATFQMLVLEELIGTKCQRLVKKLSRGVANIFSGNMKQ